MVTKQKFKNILKKSLICSLSAVSVLSLSNCSKGPSTKYIDNAIAIVYQDDKPYLINANKDLYPLDYYDEIVEIFNEYIAVKVDNKYGFINRTGKLIVEALYDRVYPMYEEKAVVIKDGMYYIIDNQGNIIYTFNDGITSESYFKDNLLVIKQDEKYGYLKYNLETNEFEKSEIIYDYAKSFENGYAVVGNNPVEIIYKQDENGNPTEEIDEIRVSENIKYNYINENFELLFNDFTFDYADNFYNNYAVVGYYDTVYVPGVDGGKSSNLNTLVYKYITSTGSTLHFDYNYNFSVIIDGNLQTTPITYDKEVYLPFAQSFKTNLAFVAKYRYSTVQSYLKEYMLIDTSGKMEYTDAIYSKTGYLFGYDSGHKNQADYQSQSAGLFSVGEVTKIGDTYAFIAGNTLNSPIWKVYYIKYDADRKEYTFENVSWNAFDKQTDDSGKITEIIPEWAVEYKREYLNNTSSNVLLKYAIENPYEMTNLRISPFCSEEYLVNIVRMTKSNKYALVKYESSTYWDENAYAYSNLLTASYVLEPIYDKIIY